MAMHAPHTAQPIWQRDVQIPSGTANAQLRCQKALEIIPGATHLFEEPGALAHVAQLAAGWFQQHLHPVDVQGGTVILVDDGLATGATMQAAVVALRQQQPVRIVVSVPIAASTVCHELETVADEVVCAETPESFYAVGLWYEDFEPTSDAEVCALLAQAAHRPAALSHTG